MKITISMDVPCSQESLIKALSLPIKNDADLPRSQRLSQAEKTTELIQHIRAPFSIPTGSKATDSIPATQRFEAMLDLINRLQMKAQIQLVDDSNLTHGIATVYPVTTV